MYHRLGVPISVGVIFGGSRNIKPLWFIWEGREYHIRNITYLWNTREGVFTLHHFSVTDDADNCYELCFHPSRATWYLSTLEASD